MPRAKPLGTRPASLAPPLALALALALTGCTHLNLGGKASPQEANGGPPTAALAALHNLGPHDVNVTMDVTMPNGTHVSEWFLVGVGKTVEHRISTPLTGNIHVKIAYTWSAEGHGASGFQDIDYVADGCARAYRMSMDVDTTSSGTWSNQRVECVG